MNVSPKEKKKELLHRALHFTRERYQRLPRAANLLRPTSPEIQAQQNTLRRDGIIKLEGLLSLEVLSKLKTDFKAFCGRIDAVQDESEIEKDGFTKEYFSEEFQLYISNDPFEFSPTLVRFCATPFLLSLIEAYLKKPSFVHQAVASRYLPMSRSGFGSFQWHHDSWGKRLNVMILLSDVAEEDQYMSYLLGSHSIRHPYERYLNSRIENVEEYTKGRLSEINYYKATGKAGDVFVFDPNGLHSGNRTDGRTRDSFIINWSADKSYVWALDIPSETHGELEAGKTNPFERIIRAKSNQRDFFPKYRSWVESLMHPSSWL